MNSEKVKAEIIAAKDSLLALPIEDLHKKFAQHVDGQIARMLRVPGALLCR